MNWRDEKPTFINTLRFLWWIWRCILFHRSYHCTTKRTGNIERYLCTKCGQQGLRYRGHF